MNSIHLVQELYQFFRQGNVPAILERLAPNIKWEYESKDHGIPWLKAREGRNNIEDFFKIVSAELELNRFEPISFLANEDQVVSVIQLEGTIKKTKKKIKDLELHLWTINEAGQVAAFRHFVDTKQHFDAWQK